MFRAKVRDCYRDKKRMEEQRNNTFGIDFKEMTTLYIVPSVLVTVVGIFTNLLSLSYFVTQRKSIDRLTKTEAVNKKLFIMLNLLDTFICIFLTGVLISQYLNDAPTEGFTRFSVSIFLVAVQCTGFITCLLGSVRVISIFWPQHLLKTKLMAAASLCFVLVMIVIEIQKIDEIRLIAHFGLLITMFGIVLFSNTLCISKLVLSEVASWKKTATITMGILSTLYCTLNMGFLVVFSFKIFKCDLEKAMFCVHPAFEQTCLYILLPLNSACNPIVYFIRNAEMRKYLDKMWARIKRLCRCTATQKTCRKQIRGGIISPAHLHSAVTQKTTDKQGIGEND